MSGVLRQTGTTTLPTWLSRLLATVGHSLWKSLDIRPSTLPPPENPILHRKGLSIMKSRLFHMTQEKHDKPRHTALAINMFYT